MHSQRDVFSVVAELLVSVRYALSYRFVKEPYRTISVRAQSTLGWGKTFLPENKKYRPLCMKN